MTKELIEDILLDFTDNGTTLTIKENGPIFNLTIELFNHTKGDTRLYDRLEHFSLPYEFNIASISEVVYDRGRLVFHLIHPELIRFNPDTSNYFPNAYIISLLKS